MTYLKRLAGWLTAALVALAMGAPAQSAPPKDTFVMAKDISDIITLDPAEVFEFSGGEVIANIYDRLMMFEPENLTKLVGGVAESWEITDGGKTITFTIRPEHDLPFRQPRDGRGRGLLACAASSSCRRPRPSSSPSSAGRPRTSTIWSWSMATRPRSRSPRSFLPRWC